MHSGTLGYITQVFNVPARAGAKVRVRQSGKWIKGRVTGARGDEVRVHLEGSREESLYYHPVKDVRWK